MDFTAIDVERNRKFQSDENWFGRLLHPLKSFKGEIEVG